MKRFVPPIPQLLLVILVLSGGAQAFAARSSYEVRQINTVRDYLNSVCLVRHFGNANSVELDGHSFFSSRMSFDEPEHDSGVTDPEQLIDQIYGFEYRTSDGPYQIDMMIYRARKSDLIVTKAFETPPGEAEFYEVVERMARIVDAASVKCDVSLGSSLVECGGFACPYAQ